MDTDQPQPGKHRTLRVYLWSYSLVIAVITALWALHLSWGVFNAIVVLALLVTLTGKQLTGAAKYVQIALPNFERRIQERYRFESDHLLKLGFRPLFFYGESFSLYRVLLIYPAFLFLLMLLNREVATVSNRSQLLFGWPVFISGDGTTYSHPMQLGLKFHTLFQDGTILLTKSFAGKTEYGPTVVVQKARGGAPGAWAEHQRKLQALVASGKQVDRNGSFETFVRISDQA